MLRKLLCRIGIHEFVYYDYTVIFQSPRSIRQCEHCNKYQKYEYSWFGIGDHWENARDTEIRMLDSIIHGE